MKRIKLPLCGRVQSYDEPAIKPLESSSGDISPVDGRPRRLVPVTTYYNYDPLLQDEYIRQQQNAHEAVHDRKDYHMVASGYSYTNGDSQQFFKQYLPEAAASYQSPNYVKYVQAEIPSPRPSASIPKFKPIQSPSPSPSPAQYYLTNPNPVTQAPANPYLLVANDPVQYYYRPALAPAPAPSVQPQPGSTHLETIYKYLQLQSSPAPTPLYNVVSTPQPQPQVQYQHRDTEQYQRPQYQDTSNQQQRYVDSAKYQETSNEQRFIENTKYQETANEQRYPENAKYQENANEQQRYVDSSKYEETSNEQRYPTDNASPAPQYQDNAQPDTAEAFQQYLIESAKQPFHPERQYLPLEDKPVRYQTQTQYQSPVAGQYQAETYPPTQEPHRFAPTKPSVSLPRPTDAPRAPPQTSVTIQKSQELSLKNNYDDNYDSQREQSLNYPTKPTKLQKVQPNANIPTHTTENYYPYEHLQPFADNMQYANQQRKPSPFHHSQSTGTSKQPYYPSSTTPLYPSTAFTKEPEQNVKIVSDTDEEQGGKSPFDFLKNFQLGKDQNYEIPLSSFTGPAKANSFSTTKKPQTSHTKSFYDPYLKLIKSNSNKINPAHFYSTQRPRPTTQNQYSSTTEPGILPPQEEQKYRENIGALKQILKGHQIDKPLPEKVTADNIDSSIDTLTTILKVLQKNPGAGSLAVPPVGAGPVKNQHFPYTGSLDNSLTFNNHYPGNIQTQTYDGSTPGRPGVDYPILSQIPQTQFDCKTQRYKGFFGDPETDCQVWHYCDLNGGQASFLCPNGTIFNQVALTCDWWFNVQCNSTAQLYVLNERLYKFIIPTKPSFPEDYAGPAVDEYLKAKYYELEAKRKPSNETTLPPGTTTEPIQSNDLHDNFLRRDTSTVLRTWR
ncbi:hypothetical protein M8J75_005977 [Diaphorina citri]|nr:hypothetical protein M8J75_005977 [Diaphorina citri]